MMRCLSCYTNITNLSLIPVLKTHLGRTKAAVAWEMSTYGVTLRFLKKNIPTVIESEYFPGISSGDFVNGVRCEDAQHTSFENDSLDLVTSNQVFEHVPDDVAGYAECYRILKVGGALVFSVPLYATPQTEKLAEVIDGKVVFLSEPEYHDSRAGGPKSALTFWRHSSNDIVGRVASAGFIVTLVDVRIAPNQTSATQIIYALKP